ncbi:hypothetical protein AGOR_G00217650 [Albula goreensis]|uniref:OCA domain-containing protein n=1 Tax=Albula goreensis TaxID=1534307 RepID=A0A8T3CNT6_9TELE|nr:hypothetical protein AGOR_G00217650 [Albula goreensis]
MILDRYTPESFEGVADREAEIMTSPLNLYSFYGSSPPLQDPVCFNGDLHPWSPGSDSDSGKTWNSAASPTQASNNPISITGECHARSAQQPRYQGVRVKNPVKDLILQKRTSYDNKQVFGNSETGDHCPALTAALLGMKRPASHDPPSTPCPKRPCTLNNNMLQSSLGGGDNPVEGRPGCETHLDIGDIILQIQECAPVSITTVQVQDTPSQAAALCPDFLPEVMNYTSFQPLPPPAPPASLLPSSQTSPVGIPSSLVPAGGIPSSLVPAGGMPPSLVPAGGMPSSPVPAGGMPSSLLPAGGMPSSLVPAGGMSFFQWQVEQEEEKLAGLSSEQLAARDEDGDTFLHVAVAQGRRALSCVLARRMAHLGLLDLKEHNGQTALQVSMAANQHLIVQDLLGLGAQINTTDCWGRSPLHVCAEKGHAQTLQAVHKMLQNTMQQLHVEAVNYEGFTALHIAVLSHNAVVQELGMTPPHSARTQTLAQKRKALGDTVSTLLLMGASYRTTDHKSGRNALHMAAEEANVELLRLFLDQPDSLAAINAKAYNGNTALHIASALQGRVAQVDAVKLLMRRGADPSIRNLEHEQPAQLVPEGAIGDQVRRILKGRGVQVRSSHL